MKKLIIAICLTLLSQATLLTTAVANADEQAGAQLTLINLNSATEKELMALPGIGKKKAQAIIQYRETYGNFTSAEDLLHVKGIGKKTAAALKSRVTVSD